MRVCDVCKKELKDSSVMVVVNALGKMRAKLNDLGLYVGTDLEFDFCEVHGTEVVKRITELIEAEEK